MRQSGLPSVTVIVPFYNKGATVSRTINSILAQDYLNFDLLIVDDGSRDSELEKIRKYRDSRLRVVTQENAGPGAARNRGMRESESEYVSFLDADDEYLPDFLSRAVGWVRDNPDCTLACGGRYWDPGRISREQNHRAQGISEGPWRPEPDTAPEKFKELLEFFFSGSILAKREMLLKYGGFYEKHCTFQEDTYLWLQIVLNEKIYRNPTPVMIWHRESSELSTGRRSQYPMIPILSDPEPIRKNCPAQYRDLLEGYLKHVAHLHARRFLKYGEGQIVRDLIDGYFPSHQEIPENKMLYAMSYFSPLVRLARICAGKA